MITPGKYQDLLYEKTEQVRPEIEELVDEKIREQAERLEGTPFSINLITYRDVTEQERQDYYKRVGRYPRATTVDRKLNAREAAIAVDILQDAGWYVKGNEAVHLAYSTYKVTINDEPFTETFDEDEPELPECEDVDASVIEERGFWRRLAERLAGE